MAQHVSYFQNNIKYTEGPFVVCDLPSNAYRIEVEMRGHYTSVVTSSSVYEVQKSLGMIGNTKDLSLANWICDTLNQMVREGKIVYEGSWVVK